MALALGMVMYGSTYVIPQFLAIISDYNALQTGLVIFWMGVPAFPVDAVLPFMIRRIHIRIAVGAGMFIMALSCFCQHKSDSGIGRWSVHRKPVPARHRHDPHDDVPQPGDGSFGCVGRMPAMLRASSTRRETSGALSRSPGLLRSRISACGIIVGGWKKLSTPTAPGCRNTWTPAAVVGQLPQAALEMLSGIIQRDAFVMTYNDVFFAMGDYPGHFCRWYCSSCSPEELIPFRCTENSCARP